MWSLRIEFTNRIIFDAWQHLCITKHSMRKVSVFHRTLEERHRKDWKKISVYFCDSIRLEYDHMQASESVRNDECWQKSGCRTSIVGRRFQPKDPFHLGNTWDSHLFLSLIIETQQFIRSYVLIRVSHHSLMKTWRTPCRIFHKRHNFAGDIM